MSATGDLEEAVALIKRSKKEIICSPEMAPVLRARLRLEGLSGCVDIVESNLVEQGLVYVFDPPAAVRNIR